MSLNFVPLSPHYNIMMLYISSTFIDKHIRLHNSFLTQFIKLKENFQEKKSKVHCIYYSLYSDYFSFFFLIFSDSYFFYCFLSVQRYFCRQPFGVGLTIANSLSFFSPDIVLISLFILKGILLDIISGLRISF